MVPRRVQTVDTLRRRRHESSLRLEDRQLERSSPNRLQCSSRTLRVFPFHRKSTSSVAELGSNDRPHGRSNHQYDLTDFWSAVNAGKMPAVSFLKAKRSQDGHAGYSSPLDEQLFLVNTINSLQQRPEWSSTAVFIMWDDSDG